MFAKTKEPVLLFITVKEPTLTKLHNLFGFHYFFSNAFLHQDPIWIYYIYLSYLLASSGPYQFLRLSLFLMHLRVLKSGGQVFYRMSLRQDLSDVILFVRLGFWVLERKTMEVTYPSHHIILRVHIIDISLLMLTLISWPRWCL